MLYRNIINAYVELNFCKLSIKNRKTHKICNKRYKFYAFLFFCNFIIPYLQRTY